MDELIIGSFCLVALTTLAVALAIKGALRGKETRAKLPPGPWNLPIIGSLHHLVGAPPHRALLRLARRHGPLMLVRLGEVPTVVVSSPEAAMEVLKTRDPAFASHPRSVTLDIASSGGKGIILAPYGEHWRQVRKICVVELLSARQVQRLESIRQDEVRRLVESIASTSTSINLTQALEALTNDIIARAVFGGRCRQQGEYLRLLKEVTTLVAGFNLVDLFPSSRLVRWLTTTERRLRKSHDQMGRIVDSIIEERRLEKEKASLSRSAGAKDEDDFLDVLLRLHKDDTLTVPLTTEIIGAIISDLFGAATDTTASTLEWAMVELIKNPRAMMRAKQEVRNTFGHTRSTLTSADSSELPYLRMVIKETLRLHPAAALILRANEESCHLMGYDIPQERFENNGADIRATIAHLGYIPFGVGRRQCPGALFATTTMKLTLVNLLYHFDWTLPDGEIPETLDMSEDIFGAASDTTASVLEWAMVELMRNPTAMERAKQEIRNTLGHRKTAVTSTDVGEVQYLRMVIKETLRLHPASALILRANKDSCSIMGYDIPQEKLFYYGL
uniref:Cytochrome P450 n=1 Tax=Leersia perrieri TaxID=77586 RepID=A0A0D9VVH5_9ORYZ